MSRIFKQRDSHFAVEPELNTEEALAAKDNGTVLLDMGMAAMLLHRVRYLAA